MPGSAISCTGRAGDQQALTVLVGPSGYGKTHLAAAVLRGAARTGRTDLQVWINASSPSAVVMGYARAAADVGLTDRGVAARGRRGALPRLARPHRPAAG